MEINCFAKNGHKKKKAITTITAITAAFAFMVWKIMIYGFHKEFDRTKCE
jgi:hypothetical protein